jgi:membrane protease YdiL (CAAX protease family)
MKRNFDLYQFLTMHSGKPITRSAYLVGLFIIMGCVYSQYVFSSRLTHNMLIVYGVPILATSLLWGASIVRKSFNNTYTAFKYGVALFGVFTVVGILAQILIFYVILLYDPNAINLLNRPNPVLHIPEELAWLMVWVSLFIIGPAEEYLFRGFIYGGLLSLRNGRDWFGLAFLSTIIFAAAHLYYATVYSVASLVIFAELLAFGMAMAITYYVSKGNLLIPAIIHGVYDAVGYLGVATSSNIGIFLRNSMTAIGLLVAASILVHKIRKRGRFLQFSNVLTVG